MRCKNCGTYNDDNRYICENCGSPLYDEDEIQAQELQQNNSQTQSFNTVSDFEQPMGNSSSPNPPQKNSGEKAPAEKKSIIVIAILVVVLVAVIVSVAVVMHGKSKDEDKTSSSSTSTTITTTEKSYNYTTEPTTESTTTTTITTTTTTSTTQATIWYINTGSSGGGSVSGDGEYKNGDKVTLVAVPDSGYTFDGWYSDGVKVSDSERYTFTANENASFSAVFNPIDIPDSEDNNINFGD